MDLYLLFFIHLGTRRVVSGPTARPDAAWVAHQPRNASMRMGEMGLPATLLLRDRDTKFVTGFDAVFRAEGVPVNRLGPAAPNLNAYAERFVQTLRTECPDHFLVCGEKHLHYPVKEFVTHYPAERPHQARGNVPLPEAEAADAGEPPILPFPADEVRYRQRLGGLWRHDHRAAA